MLQIWPHQIWSTTAAGQKPATSGEDHRDAYLHLDYDGRTSPPPLSADIVGERASGWRRLRESPCYCSKERADEGENSLVLVCQVNLVAPSADAAFPYIAAAFLGRSSRGITGVLDRSPTATGKSCTYTAVLHGTVLVHIRTQFPWLEYSHRICLVLIPLVIVS
jgi:hypothetical protein